MTNGQECDLSDLINGIGEIAMIAMRIRCPMSTTTSTIHCFHSQFYEYPDLITKVENPRIVLQIPTNRKLRADGWRFGVAVASFVAWMELLLIKLTYWDG